LSIPSLNSKWHFGEDSYHPNSLSVLASTKYSDKRQYDFPKRKPEISQIHNNLMMFRVDMAGHDPGVLNIGVVIEVGPS
jgi:hypothetical protein